MLKVIALIVLCILFIEFIARSSFFRNFIALVSVAKKSAKVITSKNISDHWKEKILPLYSLKIMTASVVMLLILCAIVVVIYLVYISAPTYYAFFSSASGLILATLFSIVYAKFRFSSSFKR